MADFGPTAEDYARHRAGFPEGLYTQLELMGLCRTGQRALDLGTGTGTLARGLARRGLKVTGVDIAGPLLAQAEQLAKEEQLSLRFVEAPAERTGMPSGAFELVTAGQCWHWFQRAEVASECRRLLAPSGHLVIAHFDWLTVPDGVVALTLQTMKDFGTGFPKVLDLGREGLYPAWTRDLREAGFLDLRTFSFDVDVPYRPEAWRGRVRASAAVGGALSPPRVAEFDLALQARLSTWEDPLVVPHRVWALVAQAPAAPSL